MSKVKATPETEAARALRRVEAEKHALRMVLRDLIEQRPYITIPPEDFEEGGRKGRLTATLHCLDGADGGYIMTTYRSPWDEEHRDTLAQVGSLEDWIADAPRGLVHQTDPQSQAWVRLFYAVQREQRAYYDKQATAATVTAEIRNVETVPRVEWTRIVCRNKLSIALVALAVGLAGCGASPTAPDPDALAIPVIVRGQPQARPYIPGPACPGPQCQTFALPAELGDSVPPWDPRRPKGEEQEQEQEQEQD